MTDLIVKFYNKSNKNNIHITNWTYDKCNIYLQLQSYTNLTAKYRPKYRPAQILVHVSLCLVSQSTACRHPASGVNFNRLANRGNRPHTPASDTLASSHRLTCPPPSRPTSPRASPSLPAAYRPTKATSRPAHVRAEPSWRWRAPPRTPPKRPRSPNPSR